MSYKTAYQDNHVSFEIADIAWEDDYERQADPEIQQESEDAQDLIDWYEGTPLEGRVDESQGETAEEFSDRGNKIVFRYQAPSISVDTSARFVTHKIIGGSTVRQKIGEDPIQVDIDGICDEVVARQLDNLRNAKHGVIYSARLPGGSLRVHFGSVSTSPLSDSGAVAISDENARFLYNYTISAVGVTVKPDQ